jgi:hypothetical protein
MISDLVLHTKGRDLCTTSDLVLHTKAVLYSGEEA